MSNLKILISGSGIAGTVFASWLLRACPTASITIIERDPELRLTGASVDIRSSAVDIIEWMGAMQEIRNRTTKEAGIQFVRGNGNPLATLGASGRTDIQSITSEFEIFRGELAKIFIEPVLGKVKLVLDEFVESYEQKDEKVSVTFGKSKEVESYDLLVAADGMGSRIRGMMLNAKPREQIVEEGIHAAYFTIKRDLLNGSRFAKWYNTTNGRVVFIRPDPHPEGRTRAIFMNVTWNNNVEARRKLNEALSAGNEAYMTLMEEQYADVGWLCPEILKDMRESDDFYCSLFAQVRSPILQDGRVVLLGDAGYATPGFGTSLAIMGGYVLAGELLKQSGHVKQATKRYEEILQPFVQESQGNDPAMQLLNPQTWWGIEIRNMVLGFVTLARLDRLAMSVGPWFGFVEKKLDMPEYVWPTQKV